MGYDTLATTNVWKKKRDDLKTKRNSLFEKYSKHPHALHLALEIKLIDDEIAECTLKMEPKAQRPSSRRQQNSSNS
ncbi:MAG: hypothetical protein DMG37_22060 [Acidobacteria bacterium]|nr:MAG: hypothetical protein DMG37_22060 [Acidobacteriota bacterium]